MAEINLSGKWSYNREDGSFEEFMRKGGMFITIIVIIIILATHRK